MTVITIEHAQANLFDLIAGLQPGEEVQILRDDQPVAVLVGQPVMPRTPRKAGSAKDNPFHGG
ncbi:MAG: antitoxin of toxin-antitoxin stability system [Planctomycetota bacterium]|nr:antitoxin of toxin-antitoxin stability system [Planctomycetota bacterium]